jgi:hypothetical protein
MSINKRSKPSGRNIAQSTIRVLAFLTLFDLMSPRSRDFGITPVSRSTGSLTFSNQVINTTSASKKVSITNNQSSTLNISSITTTGDFAQTSTTCGSTLAPASSCTIGIDFTPTATGLRSGALTFIDDAPNSPQTVSLTGSGVSVGLSPSSIGFPAQLINTTSSAKLATLTNYDVNPLSISSIVPSGDFGETNSCGTTVPAGSKCTISVTFTPAASGKRTGAITISDDSFGSPRTIALSGPGTTVKVTLISAFPVQILETVSPPKTTTLTNYDSNPLSISNISAPAGFSQSNNCGSSVPAGGSCTIQVSFVPTTSGKISGNLSITDSAYLSPQLVALVGTGSTVALVALTVTPGNKTISVGEMQTFDAIASLSDGSTQNMTGNVVWSSSNSSVATLNNNLATTLSAGSSTIGAVSVGVAGSTTLRVSTVRVTPRIACITLTQNQQFQATIQSSDAPVSWSVDGILGGNTTVGTIDSTGLYTPPTNPPAAGPHKITAVSQNDSTQSGTANIAVTDYPGTFTHSNDNLRTGQNTAETVLTPTNVNQNQFGKLFSYPVDGSIYGQPLYAENVNFPGLGTHNAVYVATEHDSVYAFDADNLAPTPLWHVSFINPTLNINTLTPGQPEIGPEMGITGTPVIDPSTGTLYVDALTLENKVPKHHLHALDITTGAEKFGGPVLVSASVPGTGVGSSGGVLPLKAQYLNSRPALLLANGVLYVSFGAHGIEGSTVYHHGWVLAYNPLNLQLIAAYSTSPNSWGASVWQSGGGPASDPAGNVYVMTGNGGFDANLGSGDYGQSYLKLSLSGSTLSVADYFAPYTAVNTGGDLDFGSGGPLLLPDQPGPYPHLAIGDGKTGNVFVLNRDQMGQFNAANDSQIVQELPKRTAAMFGKPAYWQGRVYFVDGANRYIFTLNNGLLLLTPIKISTAIGWPPASPAISSNGNSNGIWWFLGTNQPNPNNVVGGPPAILYACDPIGGAEFYDSKQMAARDTAGPSVKFTVPTVAIGKVYVGTQTELDVYGLLPQ